MDRELYATHREFEEHYWWFRGREAIVLDVLRRIRPDRDMPRVLDAGCGTGRFLGQLDGWWDAYGVDPSEEAVRTARRKSAADVRRGGLPFDLPFPDRTFDVVTLLDVLEHVEDDRGALRSLGRVLKPGGSLVLTVPAHPWLWTHHDEAFGHERRYRKDILRATIEEAGFSVRWLTHYNTLLAPPIVAVRLWQRWMRDGGSTHNFSELPGVLNRSLTALFAAERHLVGRFPLPFGISLIGVAHAPGDER